MEFLEKLPSLLNKNEESSWQKASASLDASAKIYGYRVDSVHSETFKFLGGLSRADNANNDNDGGEETEEKKARKEKISKHEGYCTLEKDIKKLNLVKYDLEFEVDPLFKSMTAKFSESGARGLLLNNLTLDDKLDVLLESKDPKEILNKEVDCSLSQSTEELSSDIRSIVDSKRII